MRHSKKWEKQSIEIPWRRSYIGDIIYKFSIKYYKYVQKTKGNHIIKGKECMKAIAQQIENITKK